jgi:hypothetical protein
MPRIKPRRALNAHTRRLVQRFTAGHVLANFVIFELAHMHLCSGQSHLELIFEHYGHARMDLVRLCPTVRAEMRPPLRGCRLAEDPGLHVTVVSAESTGKRIRRRCSNRDQPACALIRATRTNSRQAARQRSRSS